MASENGQHFAYLICVVVISIAVTGYFIGLQSPMNPSTQFQDGEANDREDEAPFETGSTKHRNVPRGSDGASPSHATADDNTILATHYSDMHAATAKRSAAWRTSMADLKSNFDPLAEVIITPEQKTFALALREKNRAFNGAPPTIPHPVDPMSSRACMACHGEGAKTETLRISKISHPVLTNCTQCHVESNPGHMPASLFRENSFIGLPAPTGGPRAYAGAPPMIPHSTWMRVDCMSCHGFAGQQGMRTTHLWRKNCQQCHAPSSTLDQIPFDSEPKFLAPPKVE